MQIREKWWAAASIALAVAVALQSYQLADVRSKLRAAEAKPYWPDRPEPLGLEEATAPRFRPTTQNGLPEVFWGEFAEDVHDCGTEQSTLIKARAILTNDTDRKTIERVQWKKPLEVEVEAVGTYASNFGMLLSEDRDELTFRYTNMKRVYQRCSTRAHNSPETIKSADNTEMDNGAWGMDANMTMNVDETLTVD